MITLYICMQYAYYNNLQVFIYPITSMDYLLYYRFIINVLVLCLCIKYKTRKFNLLYLYSRLQMYLVIEYLCHSNGYVKLIFDDKSLYTMKTILSGSDLSMVCQEIIRDFDKLRKHLKIKCSK